MVGSKKEEQSAVWSNFELLFSKESGECTGYVLCTTCKNPFAKMYHLQKKKKGSTSGTTHLKDHIKACTKKKS